jgi:outer membrane receptor protein involved in Fe transport
MTDSHGDPVGVPGFEANRDSIPGPETRRFQFLTPNGVENFDDADGTTVQLTQLTFDGSYKLTDNITLQQKMRYRDSYTRRTSITPFSVASAADFLQATYGAAVKPGSGQSLGLFYRDTGGAFDPNQNGNGLALVDLARGYTVPLEEFINDTRVLASFEALGHHDLAFGAYFADVNEDYRTNSAAVLTDVKDKASVLDAYLLGSGGQRLFQFTNGGILQYGVEFNNASGESKTLAFYGSDEWKITDKLRIDGGVRWEQIKIDGSVEGRKQVNLGVSPTAADDSVTTGNGVFTPFSRDFDSVAWTLGANYQLQPDLGAFVRYTKTFRLPNISNFVSDVNADPVIQKMNFLEAGVKYSRRDFDLYVTGFRTLYDSYEIDDFFTAPDGTLQPRTVYGDTETWGAEVEGVWSPTRWFDLHAMWTYQDARFTDFKFTDSTGQQVDFSHNRLIRTPENSFRITPALNLVDGRLRLQADFGYYGQRFAEVANQISLPAYWLIDFNARYDVSAHLQLNLAIDNVADEIGLVNGNPRAGTIENGEAGQAVYIGQSVFGRNIRAAVTYRF